MRPEILISGEGALGSGSLEIVTFLSRSTKLGRATLSSYILDLDGDTRKLIADCIEQELAAQPTIKRPKPYSSHGGVAFTLFCYMTPWVTRSPNRALDHARAILLLSNDQRRLLMELSYTDEGSLGDVHWQWVERVAIPPDELERLEQAAERLRETRVANARAQRGKVGRNEPCPCGRGKKYKKCCMNK
jgi:SEC-C motif-containing protein